MESFAYNESRRLIQTNGPNHKKCGKFYTVQNQIYEVITLEKMNVRTIYQVFEDAFTGYFVEFDKRPEIHIERWLSAGVDFSLSYGVKNKSDGILVAFLLHAPKGETVMNLATGVRREFQGQGLTGLMYERIFDELPEKGYSKFQLEVITKNEKAIRAYEKVGMKIVRTLHSWKGTAGNFRDHPGHHEIKPLKFSPEHAELTPFPYGFEQDKDVVLRRSGMLELHELRDEKELLSYAVWNPWQMNLVQLGGRNRDALEGLLSHMKLSGEQFGMINVDERNHLINDFFSEKGLVNFLSQYEMVLSR